MIYTPEHVSVTEDIENVIPNDIASTPIPDKSLIEIGNDFLERKKYRQS